MQDSLQISPSNADSVIMKLSVIWHQQIINISIVCPLAATFSVLDGNSRLS